MAFSPSSVSLFTCQLRSIAQNIGLFTANNYVRFSLILDIYLLRSSAYVYFGLFFYCFWVVKLRKNLHRIFRRSTSFCTILFVIHSLGGTTLLIWMELYRSARLPCRRPLNDSQVLSWLMRIKMKCGKWFFSSQFEKIKQFQAYFNPALDDDSSSDSSSSFTDTEDEETVKQAVPKVSIFKGVVVVWNTLVCWTVSC